jgi:hypothetical protein
VFRGIGQDVPNGGKNPRVVSRQVDTRQYRTYIDKAVLGRLHEDAERSNGC